MPVGVMYLDDVNADGIERMRAMGIEPKAVVETSTGSHQVHLHVPHGADARAIYLGAELEIGVDACARPSREGLQSRLARVPGFRNTKPNRGSEWVLLRKATSKTASEASVHALRRLAAIGKARSDITAAPDGAGAGGAQGDRLRRSHAAVSSGGSDNSPSGEDMRKAVWMAARGYEEGQIVEEIAQRRADRGHSLREAYRNARYTVRKAMDWVQRR